MKKVLGLTVALLLLSGMTGIGTWAYFSDTETSTGNQMTAGTLDLKTDDADGVNQTLFAINMQPGDIVGSENITLKNAGSTVGATVDLAFSYVENDLSANPADMSADATAASIEVTVLKYDGSSLFASEPEIGFLSDNNSNGYPDIQDLKNTDLSGQSGIGALASKEFEIAVKFRDGADKDFQADGITVTMTFTLNQ